MLKILYIVWKRENTLKSDDMCDYKRFTAMEKL